jgi:hypothetical protein
MISNENSFSKYGDKDLLLMKIDPLIRNAEHFKIWQWKAAIGVV